MDWLTPRQPRLARSSTAHTSDRQERSPGRRPITFTRRRVSPKVRSMKLECRWRDLGGWVDRWEVAGEVADHAEPLAPPHLLPARRLYRPGQGRFGRERGLAGLVEEVDEAMEQMVPVLQFAAQRPAQAEVVIDGGVKVGHAAPPGQGSARPRSACRSTLA
jgi:hypothetical protein